MQKRELHPSIEKFKEFIKRNPKLIQEVRSGNFTWQDLYEDWYLLGEEDPRWDEFKEEKTEGSAEEKKNDWIGQIIGAVKKMDSNQFEAHIQNLSQALAAIQGVISQFQNSNQPKPPQNNNNSPHHPFVFRKD